MDTIAENFMRLFFSTDPQNRELAETIYPGLDETYQQEIRAQFPNIKLEKYLGGDDDRIKCRLCLYRDAISHRLIYTCMKTGENLTEEKRKTGCRFFEDLGITIPKTRIFENSK